MTLKFPDRNDGEDWAQYVERVADQHGLKKECLESFHNNQLKDGRPELAAFDALIEWNCLETVDDIRVD